MKKSVTCAVMSAALAVCAVAGQMKPKALMIMVDGMRADVMENAPMTNLLRLRDGRWQKGYRGFSSITGHTLYDARPSSADFAFTLWLRLDDSQQPQAPIVANKDWESGKNPGLVLIGARKTDGVDKNGVCFNCALSGKPQRLDMGTFDIDYGEWCFYAVTRGTDGVLRIYQGGRDGRLYWIAEDATAISLRTGLPFWIGQDGTGKCKVSLSGDVDDFALWTRSLSHEDVRRIYEEGRRGRAIEDLL